MRCAARGRLELRRVASCEIGVDCAAVRDGVAQPLRALLRRRIRRQVQAAGAGVAGRQPRGRAGREMLLTWLDDERGGALGHGHRRRAQPAAAGGECQQRRQLLRREGGHRLPELRLRRSRQVACGDSGGAQLLEAERGRAAHRRLQLGRTQQRQPRARHTGAQPGSQRRRLLRRAGGVQRGAHGIRRAIGAQRGPHRRRQRQLKRQRHAQASGHDVSQQTEALQRGGRRSRGVERRQRAAVRRAVGGAQQRR